MAYTYLGWRSVKGNEAAAGYETHCETLLCCTDPPYTSFGKWYAMGWMNSGPS